MANLAFDWFFKLAGLSGALGFAYTLFKDWRADRDRLAVVSRQVGNYLAVYLNYRPKSAHAGLHAVVEVTTPADLMLYKGQKGWGLNKDGEDEIQTSIVGPPDKRHKIRLLNLYGEDIGVLSGSVYLLAARAERPERASIKLSIVTDTDNRKLAQWGGSVSPINRIDES